MNSAPKLTCQTVCDCSNCFVSFGPIDSTGASMLAMFGPTESNLVEPPTFNILDYFVVPDEQLTDPIELKE